MLKRPHSVLPLLAVVVLALLTSLLAPSIATASSTRPTSHSVPAHHPAAAKGRAMGFTGQTPQLRGAGQVHTQLRVTLISVRDFKPRATRLKYQWTKLGKRIPGAHSSSYMVREEDRARRLRCIVIGWKKGWQPRRVKSNVVKIAR